MTEVVLAPSAWLDQKHIVDYFDREHAEAAGANFLLALDEAIAFIAEFPDLGSPWSRRILAMLGCVTDW